MGRLKLGGAAGAANLLWRAFGVLWIADALVKLTLPFGDQPGEQSYEQVMTAKSAPPGFHQIFAWEANVFLGRPFLWWLPAAVELGAGGWLVLRPASHRALAASASWALAVWAVGEGFGGPASGGSPLTATRAPPCYTRRPRSSCSRAARSGTGLRRRAGGGGAARPVGPGTVAGAVERRGVLDGSAAERHQQHAVHAGDQRRRGAGPLHTMDAAELRWLTVGNTSLLGYAVAGACLLIGFMIFLGWLPRLFLSLGILITLAAWAAVENFGGILTGSSTDVGAGPAWILLALAFWPAARTSAARSGKSEII